MAGYSTCNVHVHCEFSCWIKVFDIQCKWWKARHALIHKIICKLACFFKKPKLTAKLFCYLFTVTKIEEDILLWMTWGRTKSFFNSFLVNTTVHQKGGLILHNHASNVKRPGCTSLPVIATKDAIRSIVCFILSNCVFFCYRVFTCKV